MSTNREISGVYFRYQNPETLKWENWCFEDLPDDTKREKMNDRELEWVKSLAKIMLQVTIEVLDLISTKESVLPIIQNEIETTNKINSLDELKNLSIVYANRLKILCETFDIRKSYDET